MSVINPGVKTTRRRAVGIRLTFVAGQLDFFEEGKLDSEMKPDLKYLSEKERRYLEQTISEMEAVGERLRKLASRMGIE